jgi:hypothetical protein
MALKVIGSGLGRTGTMSLKLALTMLDFGPCHHMVEVFPRPESLPLWIAAGAGHPDWEAIFDGFQSMVDYPGCKFWRQLADYYPDAKVLHSVRDPDSWFESTQATIFAPNGAARNPPPHMAAFFGMLLADFGDRIDDRAFMTDYFRRHTEAVKAAIPAERLLIYQTGEGWEPLCAFLGAPVPREPYPQVNSREEFQTRTKTLPDAPSKKGPAA